MVYMFILPRLLHWIVRFETFPLLITNINTYNFNLFLQICELEYVESDQIYEKTQTKQNAKSATKFAFGGNL